MEKLRIIQLLLAIVLASQGLFYLLGAAEAMKTISVASFAELRKAIDLAIADRLRILYYTTVLIGLVVLFLSRNNMNSFAFIGTLIGTVFIAADAIMAVKFNVPINNAFKNYPAGNEDYALLQTTWLKYIIIRGSVAIAGLLALLVSWYK